MSEHLGPTTVGSPGFNRKLAPSHPGQRYTNLAIGTHVFMVNSGRKHDVAGNHVHVMVASTGGTVAVDYTWDRGHIEDLATGTAPAQTFPATVNSLEGLAATASGEAQISGPVTAVQITIATAAVNEVTIAL